MHSRNEKGIRETENNRQNMTEYKTIKETKTPKKRNMKEEKN